jgi:hypothetical protein
VQWVNGAHRPYSVRSILSIGIRSLKNIPKPEKTTKAQFGPAAEELFNRIMQLTDNAGASDEHRALNYLAMRYPAIYARAAEAFAHDFSLTAVEVRPSPLSSTRKILDVIFAYTNRNTDFTRNLVCASM